MDDYIAKEHYQENHVAEGYDDVRFKSLIGRMSHKREALALESMVKKYFKKPAVILDIPCGTGRLFPVMLDAGYQVIGGDISQEMMNVGRRRFKGNPYASFKLADAENLPFEDNSMDYLTSYRFMCHLPPETRARVLDEMVRVTKKILIINFHVSTLSPLYQFNKIFRPKSAAAFALTIDELRNEIIDRGDLRLLEMKKLSWIERSSLLAVLEKV